MRSLEIADVFLKKAPVMASSQRPRRCYGALVARSSLIFRNAVRSLEIADVFLKKAPVMASSQRPRRCYGALVAFYRVPTEFLLAILCTLMTLSQRSHCVHCAVTAFALRFHGVCTALTA